MNFTSATHGKIILMGEHAVVYGQPAITIPLLNLNTQVEVQPSLQAADYLDSTYYCGPLAQVPPSLEGIAALIKLLIKDLPIESHLKIKVLSDLPIERGMGSSAATGSAICKALFAFANTRLTYEDLLHYTNFSEKIIHGTPSGVDAVTVNASQPIYYIRPDRISTFNMNLQGILVIIDSGMRGNTGAAVHDLRILKQHRPQLVEPLLQELGSLSQQTKQAVSSNQLPRLGQLFQSAQQILQTLQVSNHQLDILCQRTQAAGSLGTKITGGGRGGCLISLAADQTTAQHIKTAALAAGAQQVWLQPLTNY